ncbi:MAG: hypothetical protein RLZZ272_348 [Actinomycetota bacterium]
MADDERVAVVIVTRDTRDEVLGCLGSVGADEADDIVVVDAGSRDGTIDAVRAARPDVTTIALGDVGFAAAANAGIAATTAPVVVVLNADVRVRPGSLGALGRRVRLHPRVAAAGPRVRYPDGTPQASARRVPDPITAIGHAALGWWAPRNRFTRRYRALDEDPTLARDVGFLSGCALALDRAALESVGGFDDAYRLYVEDLDLAVRLRRAGWRIVYEPAAEVVHRVGASTSQRPWRSRLRHARGIARYVVRHLPGGPLVLLVLLPGLVLWVLVTGTLTARRRSTQSSTGEVLVGGRDG